jgi:tryptophan 2,3-dioxygenase
MGSSEPLTYGRYLKVRDLLGLQHRLTEAHDELQFIVIHQVFELWFKLLLFELEAIRAALFAGDVGGALHLLRRAHEIVRVLTTGWPVIETMRPVDFLEFRSELRPASGFQSVQFREIEYLSNLKDARYVEAFRDDAEGTRRLRARLEEPSLWDAFVALLRARGLAAATDAEILQTVIQLQRRTGALELYELVEALVEYDQLFAAWRARHVLMTERMIGARQGTGELTVAKVVGQDAPPSGEVEYFSGVHYLRTTTDKRFFPLLWESRTFVER